MNRIVLYRAEPTANSGKWWETDAGTESNGDIRIISGDGKIEWHTIIAAKDVPSLTTALLGHLSDKSTGDALTLLAQKFAASADDGNPYDAIQTFLERKNIPHKTSVW